MLIESKQYCPYCGEPIELLLDEEMLGETYIEDCQVCCRPMVVEIVESMGELAAQVKAEYEI